jgi:hypothetical protein
MTCYKRTTSCQFSTVIFKGQLHKLLPQWYKRANSIATNSDQGRTSLRWTELMELPEGRATVFAAVQRL